MNLIPNMKLRATTRMQFANLESQKVWGAKIDKAFSVYDQLEFLTVVHDVRPAMLFHYVDPNNLHQYMTELAEKGLYLVPLRKEDFKQNFTHYTTESDGSQPFVFRAVVTKSMEVATEFVKAHKRGDDITMGQLLGFPKSSCEFFDEVWKNGFTDPIWQQAKNTSEENIAFKKDFKNPDGTIKQHLIAIKANEENYLISSALRYMNMRTISHMPRSFDDKESLEIAKKWIDLAKELKIDGIDELLELMKLPYEWDAYKGYVELNTPVFKIVNISVPCFPRYTVWQQSDFYPEEAPYGLKFPWKNKMFR